MKKNLLLIDSENQIIIRSKRNYVIIEVLSNEIYLDIMLQNLFKRDNII